MSDVKKTAITRFACTFRYQQAELQNGRWAMLGSAGVLFPELLNGLGTGGPAAAQPWYDAGAGNYWAPSSTLLGIEFFLMAWVEIRRLQDYKKPGALADPRGLCMLQYFM